MERERVGFRVDRNKNPSFDQRNKESYDTEYRLGSDYSMVNVSSSSGGSGRIITIVVLLTVITILLQPRLGNTPHHFQLFFIIVLALPQNLSQLFHDHIFVKLTPSYRRHDYRYTTIQYVHGQTRQTVTFSVELLGKFKKRTRHCTASRSLVSTKIRVKLVSSSSSSGSSLSFSELDDDVRNKRTNN